MTTSVNFPAGIGCASEATNVGIGSSSVLLCLNMLLALVDSLRSLARIQPFWTKVSLPSGRISLTVACRSTSGVEDRTHTCTAPPPMTAVFAVSGREAYDTPEPVAVSVQFHCHCDALPHRPPE